MYHNILGSTTFIIRTDPSEIVVICVFVVLLIINAALLSIRDFQNLFTFKNLTEPKFVCACVTNDLLKHNIQIISF